MSISYGWEKLHKAIHSLCGQANQSERLTNAVVYSLIHINSTEDLPEEMQDEFNEFMQLFKTVIPEGNEGMIQASINEFSETEISNAIDKIISFYDSICRHRKY